MMVREPLVALEVRVVRASVPKNDQKEAPNLILNAWAARIRQKKSERTRGTFAESAIVAVRSRLGTPSSPSTFSAYCRRSVRSQKVSVVVGVTQSVGLIIERSMHERHATGSERAPSLAK